VGGWLKLGAQAVAVGAVGALAAILVWNLTHQPPPPKVGARAPGFSLPRLSGDGTLSLASLRGKAVVLNFWRSACYACKREAPVLERLWQDDRSRGLEVIGVDSADFRSDGMRFVRAHGVTYPVVFDGNGVVAGYRYDLFFLPATYVLNRKGKIVGGQILGPISDHPFAQTFSRYVRAALKS
jgi:peroxiredoxin